MTQSHTILVVEDCEADIDALVACLGDTYRVQVETDGQSALNRIRRGVPDMVLLDILMPGMDGFEVCRQIMADPEMRETLVVFVTGLTEVVDETRGLELGAVDYITKPFNFAVIRAKIRTHLDLATAKKELAHQNQVLRENIRLREQVEQISRHDLKTPIQVMLSAAQLMASSTRMTHERRQRLLQEQVSACYTMVDMLDRTMVLYRMEQGTSPLVAAPVDILSIFNRLFLSFADLLSARGVSFGVWLNGRPSVPEDTYIISCDEMLFYVMVSNLFKNALEASPEGGAIHLRIDDAEPGRVRIEMENRGVIPESIRGRFFEKFVTQGKSKGTGIGTYSAKLTAKLHGGDIGFLADDDSDITVIWVDLPK